MATVDLHLRLSEETARKLRDLAHARSLSESAVVEQALDLLDESGDMPHDTDYRFSVAAMREDWDAMPDDWVADETKDAVSPR